MLLFFIVCFRRKSRIFNEKIMNFRATPNIQLGNDIVTSDRATFQANGFK